jgi:Haloacid dehalogenase-like hydrolase
VPGAPEAVRWLRDQGLTVRFTTNTDSVAPAALADRLARLGFPASEDELVTPIAVAERLFASSPLARVLAGCLAGPGDRVTHVLVAESQLRGDLRRAGRRLPGRPGRGGAGRHQVNRIARPRRRRASRHGRVGVCRPWQL